MVAERSDLGELLRCVRLERLRVRNFKSLRDVEIGFPSRVTILVGPNGSGKTALIEAIELLKSLLEFRRGRVANPFATWWGYRNVVWRHEVDQPIEISMEIDLGSATQCIGKDNYFAPYLREPCSHRIRYTVRAREAGGSIEMWEEVAFDECGFGVEIVSGDARLHIHNYGRFSECVVECLKDLVKQRVLKELAAEYILVEKVGDRKYLAHHAVGELTSLIARIRERYDIKSLEPRIDEYVERAIGDVVRLLDGLGLRAWFATLLDMYVASIREAGGVAVEGWGMNEEIIREDMLKAAERRILSKGGDELYLLVMIKTANEVLRRIAISFTLAIYAIGGFIDSIQLLKDIDIEAAREPQPLAGSRKLDPSARNLTYMLFLLGKGRLPEEVIPVLKAVLGVDSVSGYFEPTPDGRVLLKLVVDDLELAPTSIPSGVWKALAIETAILSRPTLLVIDEFENSLHAEAQKYLLDELRNCGAAVIIATHSPIPIDYARSLDEVLVLELVSGETRAWRLKDSKELREKLSKLGLTPSEALLYGFLERREA
ncbi:MAG: AAA family ATPase [Crenarchaeota archaeon]|nr:AAA family ATPase [Thermoproteota archaeon]